MNKKLIIPIFVLFLFSFAFIVNGQGPPQVPYAISGDVKLQDGQCISGFNIKIKAFSFAQQIDVTQEVELNKDCEYAIALGNAPYNLWYSGMPIQITFCDVARNPNCVKNVKIGSTLDGYTCDSAGGCKIDFTYSTADYIPSGEKPVTEYIKEFVCWDGSRANDASACPIQQPITEVVKEIVCQDGTRVANESDCLETKEQISSYLIAGIGVGGVAVGIGIVSLIRYYVRKKQRARATKMADSYVKKRKLK